MRRGRALLVLLGVVAVAGCGTSQGTQTTTEQEATTPPAIQSTDEPATVPPPASKPAMCPDIPTPCEPTPAEAEKLQEALTPRPGSEPRAIAELRLPARGPEARARLVAWPNRSGRLCLETQVEDVKSASFGPCVPGPPCGKICLQIVQTRTGDQALYLLAGAVATGNDGLRVTRDDGHVATYELSGPVVPNVPGYRVFMLDLGRHLYRRLELLAHDQVVAEETLSAAEIRSLRCNEGPPVLPSQDAHGRPKPLHECVQRPTPK